MSLSLRGSLLRGELRASGPFALFFALHIVLAAAGMWTLFKLAAVIIFLLAHLHTPLVLHFSRCERADMRALILSSTVVAILFSTGYWYAVNAMELSAWIFAAGLSPVLISLAMLSRLTGQVEEGAAARRSDSDE